MAFAFAQLIVCVCVERDNPLARSRSYGFANAVDWRLYGLQPRRAAQADRGRRMHVLVRATGTIPIRRVSWKWQCRWRR